MALRRVDAMDVDVAVDILVVQRDDLAIAGRADLVACCLDGLTILRAQAARGNQPVVGLEPGFGCAVRPHEGGDRVVEVRERGGEGPGRDGRPQRLSPACRAWARPPSSGCHLVRFDVATERQCHDGHESALVAASRMNSSKFLT